ncbi:hypothetical protein CYMTET_4649 [Cymbomonas tetramitiformis]|uniref:Uncharacterized protein n=1 Tax=Cymbomonas tetramitiformis TaxID=36881 RepID=A0AAE0H0Y3_9CHLO|nr:hypothetical protein CYMTET_4649 [Cymbomonas tetramitiformis]
METRKELRRLAKPNDRCYNFDLQNDYHRMGIDPAFQEYADFNLREESFKCRDAPFGHNDSPICISVKSRSVPCCHGKGAKDPQPGQCKSQLEASQQKVEVWQILTRAKIHTDSSPVAGWSTETEACGEGRLAEPAEALVHQPPGAGGGQQADRAFLFYGS